MSSDANHGFAKVHVSRSLVKRPNGDIYVYERVTAYDAKIRNTRTIAKKLLGKIPYGETEMVPTNYRRKPRNQSASYEEKVAAVQEQVGKQHLDGVAAAETQEQKEAKDAVLNKKPLVSTNKSRATVSKQGEAKASSTNLAKASSANLAKASGANLAKAVGKSKAKAAKV